MDRLKYTHMENATKIPGLVCKARLVWLAVVVIFAVHTLGLGRIHKPVEGIWNADPIVEKDWCLHFHHLQSQAEFWQTDGRLWGYNPYFMAGYPSNTIQDLSIKFFQALAVLTPGNERVRVFKLLVFLFTAALPWMAFVAGRNFFWDTPARQLIALTFALLGTACWWNSLAREMYFYGMVGFQVTCYFALLTTSVFYRLLTDRSRSKRNVVVWIICITLLPSLHLMWAVIFVPIGAWVLLAHRKSCTRATLVAIGMGALVSAAVNWPWLGPFLAHLENSITEQLIAERMNRQEPFFSVDPWTFFKDYCTSDIYFAFRTSLWEKGLRLGVLLLGVGGICTMYRTLHRDRGLIIGAVIGLLFCMTYWGSFSPIKGWQPMRFKIALDLWLALSAAYLTGYIAMTRYSRLYKMLLGSCLGLSLTCLVVNLVQTECQGKMRLRSGLSPVNRELVTWAEQSTSPDARILFEESGDETRFQYNGAFLSSILAHVTGRQLIGGPSPYYNDRHHFANFRSGKLFGRDIATYSPSQLHSYCERYNIRYIIMFHPRSVQAFRNLGEHYPLTFSYQTKRFSCVELRRQSNWFITGRGHLEAKPNRIHCWDVEGNEVVLKYHWVRQLVSQPDLRIEPLRVGDDPIPFIKIVNPPRQFTLRMGR